MLHGWFTNVALFTNTIHFTMTKVSGLGDVATTNRYPSFYCGKLMKYFACGSAVVAATKQSQRALTITNDVSPGRNSTAPGSVSIRK